MRNAALSTHRCALPRSIKRSRRSWSALAAASARSNHPAASSGASPSIAARPALRDHVATSTRSSLSSARPVVGDGRGRHGPRTGDGADRDRRPSVERAASGRADGVVERVLHECVSELEHADVGLAHERTAHGRLQKVEHAQFFEVEHRGDPLRIEVAPEHSCRLQDVPGGRIEAPEPLFDHRTDRVRRGGERQVGQDPPPPVGTPADRTLLQQQAEQLDHEERVAARLGEQVGHDTVAVLAEVVAGDVLEERSHLPLPEATDGLDGHRGHAPQSLEPPSQVAGPDVARTARPDDHHTADVRVDQPFQHVQRVVVRPLEVVHDEQQRSQCREATHEVDHCISEQAASEHFESQELQSGSLRQRPADQVRCCAADEHLTALRQPADSGGPIDHSSVVLAVADECLAAVHAHPHGDRGELVPRLVRESALRIGGRGQRVVDVLEHAEGAVALATVPQEMAAVRDDGGVDQRVVPLERDVHHLRGAFPQRRGTDDVGHQERHHTRRERHTVILTHRAGAARRTTPSARSRRCWSSSARRSGRCWRRTRCPARSARRRAPCRTSRRRRPGTPTVAA